MTIIVGVLLGAMFIAYATFAYRYFRFSPWRATWHGITLQSQKVTLAIMSAYGLIGCIVEPSWVPDLFHGARVPFIVFVVLLTLIAIQAWATLAGLLHVQSQTRPVPRYKGTGYVPHEDIEKTNPRRGR